MYDNMGERVCQVRIFTKTFDGDMTIVFERQPMPEDRFKALCGIAKMAIAGGVVIAVVYMTGLWGLAGAGAVGIVWIAANI